MKKYCSVFICELLFFFLFVKLQLGAHWNYNNYSIFLSKPLHSFDYFTFTKLKNRQTHSYWLLQSYYSGLGQTKVEKNRQDFTAEGKVVWKIRCCGADRRAIISNFTISLHFPFLPCLSLSFTVWVSHPLCVYTVSSAVVVSLQSFIRCSIYTFSVPHYIYLLLNKREQQRLIEKPLFLHNNRLIIFLFI